MTTGEQRATDAGERTRVVGIVADPDMSTRAGMRITDQLVHWLNDETSGSWRVEVRTDPVAAGETAPERVLDSIERHRGENSWSLGICVTDLPLFHDGSPVVAQIDDTQGLAFISLPALGGAATSRRLWKMLTVALTAMLKSEIASSRSVPDQVRFGTVRFGRSVNEGPRDAIRYAATVRRGWLAVLAGMVSANRPWRLVFGLSSALATSLATSAFGLSSSTMWEIGDQLDPARKALTTALATALLVLWLIVSHHLWERRRDSVQESLKLSSLYNSSTVVSLSIGVLCMYLFLFLINIVVAYILIPESLLTKNLEHGTSVGTYLNVGWMFATMGILAGALGTSLESDRAVRQAAYGYRERQRRAKYQDRARAEGDRRE